MLGCFDFCGHYDWTFEWLRREGGEALLREFWDQAIHGDSQQHAAHLIQAKGIAGMKEYWDHTLVEEKAGYHCTATDTLFRIDMQACPSLGFLLQHQRRHYHDYCDHCMGWVGPLLKQAGFTIDHEHNHCGQCWWEMRAAADTTPPSEPGAVSGDHDVRQSPTWSQSEVLDRYSHANAPDDKTVVRGDRPADTSDP